MNLKTAVMISALTMGVAPAAQLLVNPGFETPLVTSASVCSGVANALCFDQGASIGGWAVVGSGTAANSVLLLNNTYTEFAGVLHFTSQEGNQNLDLTGPGNQGPNGVEQSVATVAGAAYNLSFWIGNQDTAFAPYATPSSVTLLVNGAQVGVYTNSLSTSADVNWLHFNYTFTGVGSSTTVRFLNATVGDDFAGLDNVTLDSAVPEPSTVGLMFCGALVLARRRLAGAR